MSTCPSKELETFENPQPGRDYVIRFDCPEFTCLCPLTGQPDFARFELEYVPDQHCIETRLFVRGREAYEVVRIDAATDHMDSSPFLRCDADHAQYVECHVLSPERARSLSGRGCGAPFTRLCLKALPRSPDEWRSVSPQRAHPQA